MSRVLPILFNTEMVQAILDNRKTATRRLIKPRYKANECSFRVITNRATGERRIDTVDDEGFTCRIGIEPPCQPGDILYVRETVYSISDGCFIYRADCKKPERVTCRPSIHMPKAAARIWLKVTDVRVERLREISTSSAMDEGFTDWNDFVRGWDNTIKPADRTLYGWDANPWVWVIEFERCEKPGGENA